MPEPRLFFDLVVIVSAAAAVAVVGRRLRLPLIPGYLIVGAIIGPHAWGAVRHAETVESVSRLAVILLMFTIGLHMDVGPMRRAIRPIVAVGLLASLVVTLIGWPLGRLFGLSSAAAVAVGGAMSISSTAAVLKMLQERRELNRTHGRLVFGSLLVQDLLAVAMLGGIPILAAWAGAEPGEDGHAGVGGVAARMVIGLAGVAVMVVAGRAILPRLLAAAARAASGEVLIVVSAAVALCAAALTTFLGFTAELGAFLAGFLLASTNFRHQIAGQLVPIRDLFMAVFFTTVGLEVNPAVVLESWYIILGALAATLVVKTLITGGTAWASGAAAPVALLTGIALANAGEFSIVLLSTASAAGVIDDRVEGITIALIVCTLIAAPALIAWSHRWAALLPGLPPAPWIKHAAGHPHAPPMPAPHARHVIVAGYGVIGRAVADRFLAEGIPFTVIELNPATVRTQSGLGRSIVYGDVANREVLESAGVRSADAVVLTIPDEEALYRACPMIREMAPEALIAARTAFMGQAMLLTSLGADIVTVAEVATAEAMARQVLDRLHSR